MKRDLDLIRQLLLALETQPRGEAPTTPRLQGFNRDQRDHHMALLIDAGLAFADGRCPRPRAWVGVRLTWAGHDYLDGIRDPAIWRHTKRAAGKLGSWSLETVGAIARAAILARAESMGLALAA